MKCVHEFNCEGYYLFESKSSSRSAYFETEEEIREFKQLWIRYLGKFIETYKVYFSSEGYQILIKVRKKSVVNKEYVKMCKKRGKKERMLFKEESWRIISEQMRILHSVYARFVNRERGRKGVMVQIRYKRYIFEGEAEFRIYEREMDAGKEIEGQEKRRYKLDGKWKTGVRWELVRGGMWVKGLMSRGFHYYVVSNLINYTKTLHSSPQNPTSPP